MMTYYVALHKEHTQADPRYYSHVNPYRDYVDHLPSAAIFSNLGNLFKSLSKMGIVDDFPNYMIISDGPVESFKRD